MANTKKYLNHLLQNTGITPACSEEERVAADIIASIFRRHGFQPEVQEFSASASEKIAQAVLGIVAFLGAVLMGIGGIVGIIGLLLALAAAVVFTLERSGKHIISQLGNGGLSQNVIAYHKASGPLASPRNRPVVVVAHYDSPRADLLCQEPFASYRPLLVKLLPYAMLVPAILAIVRLLPLPGAAKVILWLLAIVASLVPLACAVSVIANRFVLPYTNGSVCNKSSVAALLGVMDAVSPYEGANEFPQDAPYDEFVGEQQRLAAEALAAQMSTEPEDTEVEESEDDRERDFTDDEDSAEETVAASLESEDLADDGGEDNEPVDLGSTVAMSFDDIAPSADETSAMPPVDTDAVASVDVAATEDGNALEQAPLVNDEGNIRFGEKAIRGLGMLPDSCAIVYDDGDGNQAETPSAEELPIAEAAAEEENATYPVPIPVSDIRETPGQDELQAEPEPEVVLEPESEEESLAELEPEGLAPVSPAEFESESESELEPEPEPDDQLPLADDTEFETDSELAYGYEELVEESEDEADYVPEGEGAYFTDVETWDADPEDIDGDIMEGEYEQLDSSDEEEDDQPAVDVSDEEELVEDIPAADETATFESGSEVFTQDGDGTEDGSGSTVLSSTISFDAQTDSSVADGRVFSGDTQMFSAQSPKQDDPARTVAMPAPEAVSETVGTLMDQIAAESKSANEVPQDKPQRSINVPSTADAPKPRTPEGANRASLFDLPDPSAAPADPFASGASTPHAQSESPSQGAFSVISSNDRIETISAPVPQNGKPRRRISGLFGRKKKKSDSMSEWLGVDEDFDAKDSGRDIGSWDNFESDDSGWKGGATGAEGVAEGELRDAITSMGDDELLGHDIWFVAAGASENGNAGIKAFLGKHRDKLRGVFLINLECVGAGQIAMLATEGERRTLKGDKRIMKLVQKVSSDFHHEIGAVDMPYVTTDAHAAMSMSLRSLTIAGIEGTGFALSHTEEDIDINVDPENIDMVADVVTEVIRRS